ncbi:glycosyltransferase family 2 protein [Dolichospermum sp. FACHB-1091]|uniref:glycosyltransferase n=1 Tax=Dolichospermum sp. FACHB-1091 TaxID=2692798 RepID=UPI0016813951|nr:glycosyltransferase family 2 protein [Dolichospermum sp. FACHB-1091]MBD2441696.1 glycosyltransferase family 2 protein [Dolichospermum sp. FACHB-1091]
MNTNSSNSLLSVPCGALRISELTPDPKNENNIMLLSVVIPTYKERDNIENVVNILSGLLDQTIPGNYELIVVDDDSPDRTWEVAENLISDYPQLRVMRRQEERGLSSAVIRGWQAARGSILGVIDGDLQHPPEVLTQLWQKIEQGADLAVASRHVEGGGVSSWSVIRRFLSRGAQVLGLVILPEVVGRVSDPMSGYFMVRRKAIANTTLNPIGYKILLEVIGRGQIREIGEAGYIFRERTEGESKVTWKQYVDYIQHLIRLRLSTGRIGKISQKVNFPVGRFLRFGAVGLSGVFVDLTIFHLMRTVINLGLTRSTILSAEIAILNNFLWNDLWTFGDISRKQRGKRQCFKRFLKFNIVCLAGIIIQTLVVNFLFNNLGMNQYIAKLIAIAVATIWNFWVNLKLSWRVTEVK